MKCIFCGKEVESRQAHHATPAVEGYCCSDCNAKVVLPLRLFLSSRESGKQDTALWVKPDSMELVKPQGKYFTLPELQKAVDGYIQLVPAPYDDCLAVANEEGLLIGLPLNTLYGQVFGYRLVGNVLIVPASIFEAPDEEDDD